MEAVQTTSGDSQPVSIPQPSSISGSSFLRRYLTTKSAASPTDAADSGLQQVSGCLGAPRATLIFVHGLGGHPTKTWSFRRDPTYFWPSEWLPSESGLEDVRIYTFGYPADWSALKQSTLTILDFAKKLNFEILMSGLSDAPIIFVVHSMGGLVVKKAYMLSMQDVKYEEVASSIKQGGIIFLGTPHRGSESASTLHKVLSVTIGSKSFIQELMTNSSTLTAINEDFRHHAKDLKLWSFYETKPTLTSPGFSSIIVDRSSATLGYDNEGSAHIHGDHHTICKFATKDDPGYQTVKKLLVHLVCEIGSPTVSRQTPQAERRTASLARRTTAKPATPTSKDISKIVGQEDTAEDSILYLQDVRIIEDSCKWISEKESYIWWRGFTGRPETRYMWLKAPPGAGKSVLMGYVVDQLRSDCQECAFYFFRVQDAIKRTTRAFLLSMVAQSAKNNPVFFERLVAVDTHHLRIQSMSNRVMWQKVFMEILLETTQRSSSFWVLDGLDEAEKPGEIVSLLGRIPSTSGIRVLIASRTGIEMERDFQRLNLAPRLKEEVIRPEDTKNDMCALVKRELESLPFGHREMQEVVSMIVEKSQGIFLWVSRAVQEILATVHTRGGVQEALAAIPPEMEDFLSRILDEMSTKSRDHIKRLAKAILQHTICAIRPLTLTELQATLQSEFGHIAQMEYTIRTLCPHLLRIEEIRNYAGTANPYARTTSHVQPLHATVRDFLLGNQNSEFAIDSGRAHQTMAIICLAVWNQDTLKEPISRVVYDATKGFDAIHPLIQYSSRAWFEHVYQAEPNEHLLASLTSFLRTQVLFWIEVVGLQKRPWLIAKAARRLKEFARKCQLSDLSDRNLITGWAVDLSRVVSTFGQLITGYPFSIHGLIPPFCPKHTRIGRQFGPRGDVTVVGTAMRKWDDCMAHITVGLGGERCRTMVASNSFIVVGLSDSKGTFVVYPTDTFHEARRSQHDESLSAISMSQSGDQLVTGGYKITKIWDMKSGMVIARMDSDAGARCLALGLTPGNDTILSAGSNNTLTIWNINKNEQAYVQFPRPSKDTPHRGAPSGVTIDATGTRVAVAYEGWPLEIWDIKEPKLVTTLGTRNNPLGFCFNHTNDDVYGIDQDGTLMHRDCGRGAEREINAQCHVIVCNSSGTLLAAGDSGGRVKIYSAASLELLHTLGKYDESITGLAFSPDGTRLYDIRDTYCNVWVPDVLHLDQTDLDLRDGHLAGTDALGLPSPDPEQPPEEITAIICHPAWAYIFCGTANGKVKIYDANTAQELHILYEHASTVNIEALVWSPDGFTVASGDSSGRIVAASLPLASSDTFLECTIKVDFRLDTRLDGCVCQLLINPAGDRLLVHAQLGTTMVLLKDGSAIGTRQVRIEEGRPAWITHPEDEHRVILIGTEKARIYDWDTFSNLSSGKDISLVREHPIQGGPWKQIRGQVRTSACATPEGQWIITTMTQSGDRSASTRCSVWRTKDIREDAVEVKEDWNTDGLHITAWVGMHLDRGVFLGKDFWLQSLSMVIVETKLLHHFVFPFGGLYKREKWPQPVITPSGDIVYANHGELVLVKNGMKASQVYHPWCQSWYYPCNAPLSFVLACSGKFCF